MFSSLRSATNEARRLTDATGLTYFVVSTADGLDYYVVRSPTDDMVVWRRVHKKQGKK